MAVVHWQTEIVNEGMVSDLAWLLEVTNTRTTKHLQLLYSWAADYVDRGMLVAHQDREIAEASLWGGDPTSYRKSLEESGWLVGHHRKLFRYDEIIEFRKGGRLGKEEWTLLRLKVLRRDDYVCHYCGGRKNRMEVDHIVPVSQEGNNEMSNLVTACYGCNRSKGTLSYREYLTQIGTYV